MSSLAEALDLRTLGLLVVGLLGILVLPLCLVVNITATRLAAAPQISADLLPSDYFGPRIDPIASYDPQSTCDPTQKPGVAAFHDFILAAYPQTSSGGITRECSANSGATSEHKEGRAFDWMVSAHDPTQRAWAEGVIAWLLAPDRYGNQYAMARRLGIMYIIWNEQQWGIYRASDGWRPYSGDSPHTDHVHFSFSWSGALQQTTYWHPERSCDPSATTPPIPQACGGPPSTPGANLPPEP